MKDAVFTAKINGPEIHCEITVQNDLEAPTFCFSLMAPPAVVSGGEMIKTDGGYGEVLLPDLSSGVPHELVLRYSNQDYAPVNRAWLPLGAYLRAGGDIISLPKQKAGVLESPISSISKPSGLCLVPAPKSWRSAGGTLEVPFLAVICPLWKNVEALAGRCNLEPLQNPDGVPTSVHHDDALAEDGHIIEISPDGIEVRYGGDQGAHYAGISLLILRACHDQMLPCGVIEDAPRFGWRGQHLDCARHFYEVGTITKLLDLMALLKMNRFHWHFSDDEAFRLELDGLPELARQTAHRGEGRHVPGVFGGGPCSGGTYTKDDARTVIKHATSVFVDVMPEIEFPAHALALARTFPQTRDSDDKGQEISVQGYGKNVLNPALPETWAIIESIAFEVAELFPFGNLHLGADELPEGTWSGSPAVDQLKLEMGLETSDDVLGWALSRLAGLLETKGIRTAAWEEAARGKGGGIGHDAILFSWTGQKAGIEAAKSGYDIVMLPAQHVYLDMAHTNHVDDWGAAWAAFIDLSDTINWTVIPEPEIADRVIGVEGTFWSEFTTKDCEMQAMIAPRILGVASKGWCNDEYIDADEFLHDARRFCGLLTQMGWDWNSACFKS